MLHPWCIPPLPPVIQGQASDSSLSMIKHLLKTNVAYKFFPTILSSLFRIWDFSKSNKLHHFIELLFDCAYLFPDIDHGLWLWFCSKLNKTPPLDTDHSPESFMFQCVHCLWLIHNQREKGKGGGSITLLVNAEWTVGGLNWPRRGKKRNELFTTTGFQQRIDSWWLLFRAGTLMLCCHQSSL